MIGWRLTTLLLCVTLCWTQDTEWDWSCGNVTAQDGVDISQVLGAWRVAAVHGPGLAGGDDECYFGEILSPNQNHSSLIFRLFTSNSEGCISETNSTINIITPSKWIIRHNNWTVLDLPPEGNTLAMAGCGNAQNSRDNTLQQIVMVFTKSGAPDLQPVYNKIEAAGLSWRMNFTTFSPSCVNGCL